MASYTVLQSKKLAENGDEAIESVCRLLVVGGKLPGVKVDV